MIDLALLAEGGEARSNMVQDLFQACSSKGFFYLKNHGIPEQTVGSAVEAMDGFFKLPMENKVEISINRSRVHPHPSLMVLCHEGRKIWM